MEALKTQQKIAGSFGTGRMKLFLPTWWWDQTMRDLKQKLNQEVVTYGCFQKEGYPQIIHFNRVFHYKPSILGYPYFWFNTHMHHVQIPMTSGPASSIFGSYRNYRFRNMYIPRIIVGNCHFPHFPTWMGYVNDGRRVSTPYIGNGHPTFNDGNPRNGFV